MTTKLYSYNSSTKEYAGETKTTVLSNGIISTPSFTTEITPPTLKANEVALWNGEDWVVKSDYRQETWFDKDGNQIEIDFIGDPKEQGLLKEQPDLPEKEPIVPPLTARQFWQAALVVGVTEEGLTADVSNSESPLYVEGNEERESVLIDIKKTTQFSRDHYLIEKLTTAKNIPAEQLNSLWQWASQIQ